ncbi:hypothetical protein ACHAW5_001764, partial [Stephanodiscus triporus]
MEDDAATASAGAEGGGEEELWVPSCEGIDTGNVVGPACSSYATCNAGVVVGSPVACTAGTLYNKALGICDHEANVICYTSSGEGEDDGVTDVWNPSTQYRYDDFMAALRIMYLEGVGGETFYAGQDVSPLSGPGGGTSTGLVNVAAFLAQAMKETIRYDSCDENNWDVVDGRYPLSNACGQLNQTYSEYACPADEEHMQCEVDASMATRAYTNANWYGAPGPLYCGPKSDFPFTGYWDYQLTCDDEDVNACDEYEGQRGGGEVNDEPVPNRRGRTDVEGCCICNYGVLNYYLGKRAADEGRESRYPDIDFCKDPGAICVPGGHVELKWIAGMFYWIRSLQTYDNGWNYMDNLKSFVQGGLQDDSFIDAVSGIVNRGCHSPPCSFGSEPLDGGEERKENFKKVLGILLEPDGSPRVFRPGDTATATSAPPGSTPAPIMSSDYVEEDELAGDTAEEEEDWTDDEFASDTDAEEEDWAESSTGISAMSLWC